MKTILFQGDSITDADRSYVDDNKRGLGYPQLVTARLGFDEPGKYAFINRGISGNRIVDVYARIKKDIINLNPSVMSILIGVNDVWHEINYQNGIETPKFELLYSMLIEEVKAACPECKIMILEPFVLRGTATEENWEGFFKGVKEKAAASKRVAEKYGLEFIPLQDDLDALCEKAPQPYWLWDGVHPNPAAHELIARKWMNTYEKIK